MTPAELDAIRARAAAATAGPWRPHEEDGSNCVWREELPAASTCIMSHGTAFALGVAVAATPDPNNEDATFIAHAREDVPALLAEVDTLRAALGSLVDALPRCDVSRLRGPEFESCGRVARLERPCAPGDDARTFCDVHRGEDDNPLPWADEAEAAAKALGRTTT